MNGPTTPSKKTCYLGVIDEGSRFKWVVLLERKKDATNALIKVIEDMEIEFGMKVKTVLSDDDKMFRNEYLAGVMRRKKVQQQWSHSYTPQEVCLVEKTNYVLMNKTRAVIVASGMPEALWGEAIQYVTYTDNRTATKALNGRTPYEAVHNDIPSVKHLKPFGCVGMVFVDKKCRKDGKLSHQSRPCLFMGYDGETRGYRLLSLSTDTTVKANYVQHLLEMASKENADELLEEIPFVWLPVVDTPEHRVPLINRDGGDLNEDEYDDDLSYDENDYNSHNLDDGGSNEENIDGKADVNTQLGKRKRDPSDGQKKSVGSKLEIGNDDEKKSRPKR
ncbi:hypothetical protein Ae201684_009045 [Aphanomyces euteiches]|uniref:Integrase catalytic domain-containing protein n=1 Tax=Aphanomyces euteiches TaxID=100861 RepID=A0A6G0X2R5_9STRA|nr:hypothetical protein Ae201684_009045 [Aphanomyces euteiches]